MMKMLSSLELEIKKELLLPSSTRTTHDIAAAAIAIADIAAAAIAAIAAAAAIADAVDGGRGGVFFFFDL